MNEYVDMLIELSRLEREGWQRGLDAIKAKRDAEQRGELFDLEAANA